MPDARPPDAPASTVINAADIEPPTTITDPKARRKMKRRFQEDTNYTGPTSPSEGGEADGGEEEEDEEPRGRSRSVSYRRSSLINEDEAEVVGPDGSSSSGTIGQQNYIFLGDFVDRGYFSLETFTLLMCLKAK
jgi:serine/threonine-protein phosphatase PP1-1